MTDADLIERTIGALSRDLRPVERLWSPVQRAGLWLAFLLAIAAVLGTFADLRGIAQRLMSAPDMWLAVAGSTLTAVLAGVAAFELSVPDRSPWWAALPLPSLALWIGASGIGCLRSWVVPETHDATMAESRVCFTFIVTLSIPLAVVMVAMIRRACPLRPNLCAAVAGLAVAAGAASLLNFFHPYDASATDLMVHLAAVAVVIGVNQMASRFGRAGARAP